MERHNDVRDNFAFSTEIMSRLKQSYDKQNLTLVVMSYEIYELTVQDDIKICLDRNRLSRTVTKYYECYCEEIHHLICFLIHLYAN